MLELVFITNPEEQVMLNLKSDFQRGIHKVSSQIKWHSVASNYFPDPPLAHPTKSVTSQNDSPIPSQKHN